MSDQIYLRSSKLPHYLGVEDPPKRCEKIRSPIAGCLFFGTASVGCSVVAYFTSDTAQILSVMGASGSGWEALQSFFELCKSRQAIFISQEIVKMLAPFIAFGGTEESLNVNDKTRATIFLIWTGYLAPLTLLSVRNTLHERSTAFLEMNSDPFIEPSSNLQEDKEELFDSGSTGCSVQNTIQGIVNFTKTLHRVQMSAYVLNTLSGIGFLIGGMYAPTSLIKGSFNSIGFRQLGFTVGHLTEEFVLQTQAKIEREMRNKRNNSKAVVSREMICIERLFKVLTYIPKATPMLSAILYSFPSGEAHALIGLFSGYTVKYNRSLLKERGSFREFSLDSRAQMTFNCFKAGYFITMLVLLTEFDVPIMEQSKLDRENFGSFEPAVVVGALGTMASSFLVKKRGLDSEIAKMAFSIFVLNSFLFGNFFFWVLNDPSVGMSNEDVSRTTIVFSSLAWASLGLAFGSELGSCMTNELKPLLGKTYLPMSLFLLGRYTIEHLIGNE